MAGKPGRSGRKKSVSTLEYAALSKNEMLLPTYLEILHSIVENEDVKEDVTDKIVINTAKYLIDRSQGRVKSIHDLRFGMGTAITAEDIHRGTCLLVWVIGEQESLIKSLGKDVPEHLTERHAIVKVLNIWTDDRAGTVEAEFKLPSGQIEKRRFQNGR